MRRTKEGMMGEHGPPILGRDEECDRIERFLADPRPAAFLIEGEPGIGKTTLWRYGVEAAERLGFRVLAFRPGESEKPLTFAGLTGLLPDPLLDEVLPELPTPRRRAVEAALLRGERSEDQADPANVGLGLLSILAGLGRESLLLAVDELQWLDEATVRVLEFAFRRLGRAEVAVLAARRTEGPTPGPAPLLPAFPEDRRERLTLGPLSVGALGSLVRDRLGVSLPRMVAARLHQESGGNPFLALELARAAAIRGSLPAPGEPFPVPGDVALLVGERIDRLSPVGSEVLLAFSALARPTVEVVGRAFGAVAAKALDDLVAAELVRAEGPEVRCAHPLIASVAYSRAPPGRRRELHRRLASAVDDPEERARHLALGAEGPDAAVAEVLDAAALLARGRGASMAAADLADLAVHLTPPADASEMTRRELAATEHHLASGDAEGARSLASSLIERLLPGPQRVPALLVLGRVEVDAFNWVEAARWGERALAEAGDHSALRAGAHGLLSISVDGEPAERHAQAVFELLEEREEDDPAAMAHALVATVQRTFFAGRGFRRDLLERAVELEERFGPSAVPLNQSAVLTMAQLVGAAGDAEGALRWTDRLLERIDAYGDEAARPSILIHQAWTLLWRGNVSEAVAAAERSLALAREYGLSTVSPAATLAQIAVFLGRVDEARSLSTAGLADAEAKEEWWECVRHERVLGFIDLSLGAMEEAAGHYIQALELCGRVGMLEPNWFNFHGDLIESLVGAERLDEADHMTSAFEAHATETDYPWSLAVGARCRGLVQAARGDAEGALVPLERAMEVHERLANPFERARTLMALGQVRRRAGRRRAAREALVEALAIMEELGFPLWMAKVRAELGRLGGRRAASPTQLTEMELRTAELAAAGRTNREIAGGLFLSVRTVESHLSAAYRKLGVRSRTELAEAIAARGSEA